LFFKNQKSKISRRIAGRRGKMKRIVILAVLIVLVTMANGCASLESTGGRVSVGATGGPGALLSVISDLRSTGGLETTPGGFTSRNDDPGLGVISNERDGESKDVEIYVQRILNRWVRYSGPAVVKTPGWVKVYRNGKWKKISAPVWLKVNRLEAIHFESPYLQEVTLRLRGGDGKAYEIRFDTYGRRRYGSYYKRTNNLLISLPLDYYRLEVFSYTGKGIFKSATRSRPHGRYLYLRGDPVGYRIGNTWVAWQERL